MRKKVVDWQIIFPLALLVLSALFYWISYAFFHNGRYIIMTILDNIGFAFFEVLLVTLIIHRLLSAREKRALLKKLNMVIDTFFSEVGTELIQRCVAFDPHASDMAAKLVVTGAWSDKEFFLAVKDLKKHTTGLELHKGDVEGLKTFLLSKRSFLLSLLENQNLLEHESFTDLLWATFHLADELSRRKDLTSLSTADQQHLCGDIKRAYSQIIAEWLAYMKHLKTDYPYLFSLAMRTNPFDAKASVELQ
ncbi:MAG TPA: hypothetical protein VMD52_07355 [Patescibacteria group bacterium]|nr:hypothetical protein [Patescibacteria group bacterium]